MICEAPVSNFSEIPVEFPIVPFSLTRKIIPNFQKFSAVNGTILKLNHVLH